MLPPPYVDERLVEPETREEMVQGRLIHALPATPEHGDEHTVLNYLVRGHVAPGHTASTHLLTRAGPTSDFATDTCIRRSGIDPRTSSRYLEEVAFEVVDTPFLAPTMERAEQLTRKGVRRVFAILVNEQEVCEWSPAQARFVALDREGVLEDRTLVRPLPIRALFDTAIADDAIADALMAKAEHRRAERIAEGLAEGLAEAVRAACALLGIPLGPSEQAHLDQLDADGLEGLLSHLETHRRWPRE